MESAKPGVNVPPRPKGQRLERRECLLFTHLDLSSPAPASTTPLTFTHQIPDRVTYRAASRGISIASFSSAPSSPRSFSKHIAESTVSSHRSFSVARATRHRLQQSRKLIPSLERTMAWARSDLPHRVLSRSAAMRNYILPQIPQRLRSANSGLMPPSCLQGRAERGGPHQRQDPRHSPGRRSRELRQYRRGPHRNFMSLPLRRTSAFLSALREALLQPRPGGGHYWGERQEELRFITIKPSASGSVVNGTPPGGNPSAGWQPARPALFDWGLR